MRKLSLVLASIMAVACSFATLPAIAGIHSIVGCLVTIAEINAVVVSLCVGGREDASAA